MNKNTKPNVLIVTGIFPPDIGGPASYVPKIASELVSRGWKVTVITLSDSLDHDDSSYLFHVIRLRRSLNKLIRVPRTIWMISQQAKKASVIFANGLFIESAIAAKWKNKPLVMKIVSDWMWERVTNRGWISDTVQQFQKKHYSLKIEFLKAIRSIVTRSADTIFTPSQYLREIVKSWNIAPDCVSVIYNAPEFTAEEPIPIQLPPFEGATLITIGRLLTLKGIDRIISVAASQSGIRLIVVGDGPERIPLQRLAGDLGIERRVIFTGQVSAEAVPQYLKASDLFILNSYVEGLPFVVLEAMKAGIPVIATDAGGTGEIVKNEVNGLLIPPRDDDALRTAVVRLLQNSEERARYINAGFRTISEKFRWDHLVKLTEEKLLSTARYSHKEKKAADKLDILFIGKACYHVPLNATEQAKFQRLSKIGNIRVFAMINNGTHLYRWRECGCDFAGVPLSLPKWKCNLMLLLGSVTEIIHIARNIHLVIIVQAFQHAITPLLLRSLSGLRYKVIIEAHGDWLDSYFLYHPTRFKGFVYWILKSIGIWAFSHADAIRSVSDAVTNKLPVDHKPIYQFPAFTDIDTFIKAAGKRKRLLEAQEVSEDILFAGSLIYLKGVDDLLTAFEKIARNHQKARLILAGEGAKRNELQEKARTRIGQDRVIFTGRLTQQRLAEMMSSACCFVLPSLTEGLGLVLAEAMAVGLPLIGTKVGGIPELINPGFNGLLVPSSNSDELANAIEWMLNHPDEAVKMGQRGHEYAVKAFSADRYVKEYQRMLYEVAGRN